MSSQRRAIAAGGLAFVMVLLILGTGCGASGPTAAREDTADEYPSYEVVTINGTTEVIEHLQRGPIFYITDDPEVKRRLGVPN